MEKDMQDWTNAVHALEAARTLCDLVKESASIDDKTKRYAIAAQSISEQIENASNYLDKVDPMFR